MLEAFRREVVFSCPVIPSNLPSALCRRSRKHNLFRSGSSVVSYLDWSNSFLTAGTSSSLLLCYYCSPPSLSKIPSSSKVHIVMSEAVTFMFFPYSILKGEIQTALFPSLWKGSMMPDYVCTNVKLSSVISSLRCSQPNVISLVGMFPLQLQNEL